MSGWPAWARRSSSTRRRAAPGCTGPAPATRAPYASADLRPHIISIGNDGLLTDKGEYGNSAEEVRALFASDFQSITANWPKKRLLLYAHGGLVSEEEIVARIAEERPRLLANRIYPVYFVWHTGLADTLKFLLEDLMRKRRPEGLLEAAKDFLFERIDDGLEVLARHFGGKRLWEEVKGNALQSTLEPQGGARLAAQCIRDLCQSDPGVEVHALAHSAGGVFHALLLQYLTTRGEIAGGPLKGQDGLDVQVQTCTLWAPACRIDLFKQTYLPAIEAGRIGRFALYTLDDKHERDDDCAEIYHKSLLYLVANAGEDPEVPGPGQPGLRPPARHAEIRPPGRDAGGVVLLEGRLGDRAQPEAGRFRGRLARHQAREHRRRQDHPERHAAPHPGSGADRAARGHRPHPRGRPRAAQAPGLTLQAPGLRLTAASPARRPAAASRARCGRAPTGRTAGRWPRPAAGR
jgi:hypothetical protein